MDRHIGRDVHAASSTRKRALPAGAILSLQLVLFAACGTSGAKGSDASAGLDAPSSGGAGGGGGAGGQASADANADVAGYAGSGGGAGIDGTAGAGNTGGGSGSGGKGGGAGIGGTAGAGNSSGNGGSGGNGGGSGGSGAGGGGGGPTQTRIVDNFEQMGVDVQAPRFAWVVNDSARAEAQTAYQIIVAADEGAITSNQGTLWDSGKVASAQQYGVTYAGPALAKTTKYWWKVRTWNKEDRASAWSAASTFVTGFFQPTDWDRGAQWIRHPQSVSATTDVPAMFRKSFSISKPVKQAFLYVTGLGQFVASMNGKKIGNHEIDPAWTDYDKLVNYVTFDVTQSIVTGANAIGVMLGSGWLNATDQSGVRSFGVMRMLAQLHVVYSDGTSMEVVSDPTWKAITGPTTYTEFHGIEKYDARKLPDGWNTGTFDDSAWVAAAAATAPSGVLRGQTSPPVVAHEALSAVNVTSPAANTFVFDFGRNMNGQFEITVSGKAGAALSLTPGESLKSGKVNAGRSGTSTYTLKGGGPETWRLTFSTIGFRYLQVSGATRTATDTTVPYIMDAKAYFTYTASNSVGTFMASDARFNKIHDLAQRTLQSNLTSIHTDGPNYEKLGWQEVVWTTLPSSAYQQDVHDLFTQIMRDVRDSQRTSGLCPGHRAQLFLHEHLGFPRHLRRRARLGIGSHRGPLAALQHLWGHEGPARQLRDDEGVPGVSEDQGEQRRRQVRPRRLDGARRHQRSQRRGCRLRVRRARRARRRHGAGKFRGRDALRQRVHARADRLQQRLFRPHQ